MATKHPRDILYDIDATAPPTKVPKGELVKEEGLDLVFPASAINEFFGCPLCKGYFRNAHTIIECLHTFCKKCVLDFFHAQPNNKLICPKCKLVLEQPVSNLLRYDRQLQRLVDKIFPELKSEDDKEGIPTAAAPAKAPVLAPRTKTLEKVEVELVPFPGSNLPKLERPRIRCNVGVITFTLMKFIKFKLELNDDVELLKSNRVVGPEHSLEYLQRTGDGASIILQYRPAQFSRN